MAFKTLKSMLATLFFSLITLFLFQNCGVQKPMVEDMNSLSSVFSHSPIPSSCISCHAEAKPVVATTLATDRVSNLFYHSTVYNGDQDCASCHTQNQADVGKTWQNGLFNHKSNLGVSVAGCLECHTGNKPKTLVGTSNFDHSTIGAKDCFECHKNVGANWSTTTFSHTPTPNSCTSCHTADRPSSTIYYPADAAQPSLNLFVHAVQYNGSSDCVSCHTSVTANVGVSWKGGTFNHQTNSGSAVTTCLDCHSGSRPTTGITAHTTANARMGECYGCHTNAGVDWSSTGGSVPSSVVYMKPSGVTWANLTTAHPATASQSGMACTSCHVNYNSTFSIKGFDHANMPSGSKCVYCHYSGQQVVASGFTQTKSHKGASLTTDCSSCHSPNSNQVKGFSYPTWNSSTKQFSGGGWGSD